MSWIKKNYILSVVLLIAFIIRIFAIYPGYPSTHPDEPLTHEKAARMMLNLDIDPHKYDYPILPMHLHALSYALFFLPATVVIAFIKNPLSFIDNISSIGLFINTIIISNSLYWGRILTVVIATGSIFLTFMLAKKIFDNTTGIIAASLLTINFRHVSSSILSLNDIPNAFMTLVSLGFLIDLVKKQSIKKYLLLGVVLGVAISVKYQTFVLIPFFITQIFIGFSAKGIIFEKLKKTISLNFIYCILAIWITFILINIFPLLHFQEWKHWLDEVSNRYGIGIVGLRTYPIWFLYEIGLGNILSIFVIIGWIYAFLKKKTKKEITILSSLLVFALFFYSYYIAGGIYTRNFTSFIPIFVIFGSYGIVKIVSILFKNKKKSYILGLLFIAVLCSYPLIKYSLLLSYWFSKETNNTCIQRWLKESLPKNSKVAIVPPILPSDEFRIKNTQTTDIGITSDYTFSELKEKNFDIVAMNVATYLSHSIKWTYQGTNFWGMPIDMLDNTLAGLNIHTLSPYVIKKCVKPWPVFDDNYLIFKIPKKPLIFSERLIKEFDFSHRSWLMFPPKSKMRESQTINDSSCINNYCLQFSQVSVSKLASKFPYYEPSSEWLYYPPRVQSEIISVDSHKTYKAVVEVKSKNKTLENKRDGFVRLDFYEKKEDIKKGKSKATYISSRLAGEKEFKNLGVLGNSDSSTFATVSFQADNLTNTFVLNKSLFYEVVVDMKIKKPGKVESAIFYPWYIL